MKNKFLIICLFLVSIGYTNAQSVELYGMSGWMFAGRTGPIKIINNAPFVAGIDYVMPTNIAIGLSYSWMNSDLQLRDYYSGYNRGERHGFQQGYLLLQTTHNIALANEKIIPYSLVGLGVYHYSVNVPNFTTQVKFALGLGAGVKYMLSDKVGLKLQARVQSPIAGAGLYIGAGTNGVSSGVSTYSYLVQLETTAGLVFKF